MRRLLLVSTLLACAVSAHAQNATTPAASAPLPSSPAKKELVQKLLVLQQPGIESIARNMVEQPAMRMFQAAGQALQQKVPADKREAVGKSIEADIRKYVDDSVPIVRERAVKLAPSIIGTMMEERFTEDELKQLLAWFESPVNKKYSQVGPEMQNSFMKKLVEESRPLVEPRLQTLESKVRASLGVPEPSASAPAKAPAPKKAASK
jgi:hypothetical protein